MEYIEEVLWNYVQRWKTEDRSGRTTETVLLTLEDRKGYVELKWWKLNSMLIIKCVQLSPGSKGKQNRGVFTRACKLVLTNHNDVVKTIRFEAVATVEYATYLREIGCNVPEPFYFGANVDMNIPHANLAL